MGPVTLPTRSVRVDDRSYYRARAIQEQVAAQKAGSGPARERHDQLAMMYRFRAAMLLNEPRLPPACVPSAQVGGAA